MNDNAPKNMYKFLFTPNESEIVAFTGTYIQDIAYYMTLKPTFDYVAITVSISKSLLTNDIFVHVYRGLTIIYHAE